jgi:hypothetical protein
MELHGLLVASGESIAAAAVGSIPSASVEAQVGRTAGLLQVLLAAMYNSCLCLNHPQCMRQFCRA